jgi:hypothetical protein
MFPRFAAAFDLLAIINTVDLSHRQVFVNVGPLYNRWVLTFIFIDILKDTKYN